MYIHQIKLFVFNSSIDKMIPKKNTEINSTNEMSAYTCTKRNNNEDTITDVHLGKFCIKLFSINHRNKYSSNTGPDRSIDKKCILSCTGKT